MKNSIPWIIAFFLAVSTVYSRAEGSGRIEPKRTANCQLYETMSALLFVHMAVGFHEANQREEKLGFYRDFLNVSFIYWLNTRKGEVIYSTAVDQSVRTQYQTVFIDFRRALNREMDPLNWFSDAVKFKVAGFEDLNDETYREYVDEFELYLNLK